MIDGNRGSTSSSPFSSSQRTPYLTTPVITEASLEFEMQDPATVPEQDMSTGYS